MQMYIITNGTRVCFQVKLIDDIIYPGKDDLDVREPSETNARSLFIKEPLIWEQIL